MPFCYIRNDVQKHRFSLKDVPNWRWICRTLRVARAADRPCEVRPTAMSGSPAARRPATALPLQSNKYYAISITAVRDIMDARKYGRRPLGTDLRSSYDSSYAYKPTCPSRFFCCCSIHLELSTCWHSTVRKHSHFQTPLENPSIQTQWVLLWSTSVSSDLKALYKSIIIIIVINDSNNMYKNDRGACRSVRVRSSTG